MVSKGTERPKIIGVELDAKEHYRLRRDHIGCFLLWLLFMLAAIIGVKIAI